MPLPCASCGHMHQGRGSVKLLTNCWWQGERGEIRECAQLLITNPDMLHQSILPVHGQFERLLRNLQFVVVDEGHAYRYSHAASIGIALH